MHRKAHENKITGSKASVEVGLKKPPCWKHPTPGFCKRHKLKAQATGKEPGSPPATPARAWSSWLFLVAVHVKVKKTIKHYTKAFLSRTPRSYSEGTSFRWAHGVGSWHDIHSVDKSFESTVRGLSQDIPFLTKDMNTIRACKYIRQFLPGL